MSGVFVLAKNFHCQNQSLSGDVIELLIYHQPSVKPSLTLRPFGVLGYVAGHSLTELPTAPKEGATSDTYQKQLREYCDDIRHYNEHLCQNDHAVGVEA